MLTLEEIRFRLGDRKASIVASVTGLRIATVIDIREGRVPNPAYQTVKKLSDYFQGDAL